METLKYIVKRILLAIVILLGVSVIIYALARTMPTDFVDNQYQAALAQGTMRQEDVDRIKELYGLSMPDAFLHIKFEEEGSEFDGKEFTKSTKEENYENFTQALAGGEMTYVDWYEGSYDKGDLRLKLDTESVRIDDNTTRKRATTYGIYKVEMKGVSASVDTDDEGNVIEDDEGNVEGNVTLQEVLTELEKGTYTVSDEGVITFNNNGTEFSVTPRYRAASFWDKTGAILGGYFTWLGNCLKGDLGMSFKYKRPVEDVIFDNMGISFGIAFVATILQFLIAIPLGIKAATHQYGVVDYTVTVLTMMGISLPTFFLAAVFIRVFAVGFGWFEVGGLHSASLPVTANWFMRFGDMLWHMVLPMTVLVILSIGGLMRYTRTNTLEVLNSDYIRTARAKGLSEHTVVYKHAFRNTMIPLVTMMAGILPSLFGGAMITETVFAIPGIGKMAYDALVVSDVTFIMGYNMFLAILTVIGTLLSDLMYAVVDPRVKLGR